MILVTFSLFLTLNSFSQAGRNIIVADGDIPNSVVEAFVEKIVVSKDGYDWYLRFDGDPGDPLHLKTEGKRRKNTAIIDPNKQTACEPVRDTGCYQRI